ncbi:hypothetical protein AMTRI_Chr02g262330 [Amborella trichopoda]
MCSAAALSAPLFLSLRSLSSQPCSLSLSSPPCFSLSTHTHIPCRAFTKPEAPSPWPLLLQACFEASACLPAKSIHCHFIVSGSAIPHFSVRYLLLIYSELGSVSEATHVFNSISRVSATSLNALLSLYSKLGMSKEARQFFEKYPYHRNTITWNLMLKSYKGDHMIHNARDLFNGMPHRDVVSWNTMLAIYHQYGDPNMVSILFVEMRRAGFRPTEFTFSTVISSIRSNGSFLNLVLQLHCSVICSGFEPNLFIGSSLIKAYCGFGDFLGARNVFDEIPHRNSAFWNAMIFGYLCNKMFHPARLLFDRMPQEMRSVFSWTAMISGLEQSGQFEAALCLFHQMLEEREATGIQPNPCTYSSVLSACAGCCSLLTGKKLHAMVLRYCDPIDIVLSSSLIDMYSKCGCMASASHVFNSMREKNLVSWNAIIGGYANHGDGSKALELFREMQIEGIKPDHVTLIAVLSSCRHVGLVEDGIRYFEEMESVHKIKARIEHYGCMVDLLGRAGRLKEVEKMITDMPFEADIPILGAFLGACCVHSNMELGVYAAEKLFELAPHHPAIYLMLSKVYARLGKWVEVGRLREVMREIGAMKNPGCSWIETNGTKEWTRRASKAQPDMGQV